jgi:hypothetical protein
LKAREIAAFFQVQRFATEKELLKMTQLIADCSKVFPPDFSAIVNQEVITKVRICFFALWLSFSSFLSFFLLGT